MFFVFGPSGQVLRGGPEALGQIESLQRLRRTLALQSRTEEGALPSEVAAGPVGTLPGVPHRRAHHAASAYAQAGGQAARTTRQPLSLVRDVMRQEVVSVTPLDLEAHAWRTLGARHIGQAPVVNALGQVVGLLRWVDMAPPALDQPQATPLQQAPRTVAELMLSPVPTVAADTSLRRLAVALLETGLTGLPVTNELGVLQGYVSRTDILRAVAAEPPLDVWSDPARTW